jgi:peptidoglycan/LPS O-acetylase OafA/YrhL
MKPGAPGAPGAGNRQLPAGSRLLPLDGLRGLASLSVIACHMWPNDYERRALPFRLVQAVVKFGWSGVDLFFVLSGFLITGILLRSKAATPARYFGVFYGRRFLRVFPIYYLLLTIFLVIVPRVAAFDRWNDFWYLRGAALPYWTYLCNWPQLGAGSHAFLCVCWSLAIEEQYYLVWPLAVRLTTPRRLAGISLALFATSAVSRIVLLGGGTAPAALYKMTVTHLDGIALGSALAVAHADPGRWGAVLEKYARLLPAFGIALCALVWKASSEATARVEQIYQPVMVASYWLIAVFYGSLLVASLGEGRARALFSYPFLRRLGKYSYAAYLLQFVAGSLVRGGLALARLGPMPYLEMILSVAASYGLAALSWALIEGPLHAYKNRAPALQLAPSTRLPAPLAVPEI